jgi:hypothetical protein
MHNHSTNASIICRVSRNAWDRRSLGGLAKKDATGSTTVHDEHVLWHPDLTHLYHTHELRPRYRTAKAGRQLDALRVRVRHALPDIRRPTRRRAAACRRPFEHGYVARAPAHRRLAALAIACDEDVRCSAIAGTANTRVDGLEQCNRGEPRRRAPPTGRLVRRQLDRLAFSQRCVPSSLSTRLRAHGAERTRPYSSSCSRAKRRVRPGSCTFKTRGTSSRPSQAGRGGLSGVHPYVRHIDC